MPLPTPLREVLFDALDAPNSTDVLCRDFVWRAPGAASIPLTTRGDLLGYDTAANRIPVGADGTVLTADSAQTLGVRWATASGGVTYGQVMADLALGGF